MVIPSAKEVQKPKIEKHLLIQISGRTGNFIEFRLKFYYTAEELLQQLLKSA